MLYQLINVLSYLPTLASIVLQIIILVFATWIYKRNSYRYGIPLMVSSILTLVYNIIYILVQYPDLYYLMITVLNLPYGVASMIISILSLVFMSLNITSTILLVISVTQIYKTHEKERIE